MKVRFINGEVGEFMAWVTVDRQIYAMVLRQGKFQAWEFSSIETAPETADYSKPEPDYKQAYEALVDEIVVQRKNSRKEVSRCVPGRQMSYWDGHSGAIYGLCRWIDEHNPKVGE